MQAHPDSQLVVGKDRAERRGRREQGADRNSTESVGRIDERTTIQLALAVRRPRKANGNFQIGQRRGDDANQRGTETALDRIPQLCRYLSFSTP